MSVYSDDLGLSGWQGEIDLISAVQCRMARAALGFSRPELARRASVSTATLSDFECGRRDPYMRTLRDIRETLEGLGITFLDPNNAGSGVRFREP